MYSRSSANPKTTLWHREKKDPSHHTAFQHVASPKDQNVHAKTNVKHTRNGLGGLKGGSVSLNLACIRRGSRGTTDHGRRLATWWGLWAVLAPALIFVSVWRFPSEMGILTAWHDEGTHTVAIYLRQSGQSGSHPTENGTDYCAAWSEGRCAVWSKTYEYLENQNLRLREELNATERDGVTSYKVTSEARVEEIHETATVVVKNLRSEGGNLGSWFSVRGTLIGAMRCHPPGMMKWDDGVDLAIRANDLEQAHIVLRRDPRLKWERHEQLLAYKYGLARTDKLSVNIFGLGLVNASWHLMAPNGEAVGKTFVGEYYKDEEIQDVVPCRFWDITLNCPIGGLQHLQRTFGEKLMSAEHLWHQYGARRIALVMDDAQGRSLDMLSVYFPAMSRSLMGKLTFGEKDTTGNLALREARFFNKSTPAQLDTNLPQEQPSLLALGARPTNLTVTVDLSGFVEYKSRDFFTSASSSYFLSTDPSIGPTERVWYGDKQWDILTVPLIASRCGAAGRRVTALISGGQTTGGSTWQMSAGKVADDLGHALVLQLGDASHNPWLSDPEIRGCFLQSVTPIIVEARRWHDPDAEALLGTLEITFVLTSLRRMNSEEENARLWDGLKAKWTMDDSSPHELVEATVEEIYGTLAVVVENLRASNLTASWFADGGTLLGALRCHPPGMMKWDDDLDLSVRADDLEAVHNVLRRDPRLKWERHGQFLAYKYGLAGDDTILNLDFFGLGLVDTSWYYMATNGQKVERSWAQFYFEDEEIQDIVPCRFWDITLNCPVGGLQFLQRVFGRKVLSTARVWNHQLSGQTIIRMERRGQNLNQHTAYFPAISRGLMNKLAFSGGSDATGNRTHENAE